MPAGPVQQQHSVGALGDSEGNLVDVELHGLGIGEGQRQAGTDAPGRADGAEQIGAFVALVGGLDRPCAASGPLPNQAVLLADAGLVLEPDLDRLSTGYAADMSFERAREVFLNAWMTSPFCFGWRGRALTCEKPRCFKSLPTVRS